MKEYKFITYQIERKLDFKAFKTDRVTVSMELEAICENNFGSECANPVALKDIQLCYWLVGPAFVNAVINADEQMVYTRVQCESDHVPEKLIQDLDKYFEGGHKEVHTFTSPIPGTDRFKQLIESMVKEHKEQEK